MKKRILALLLCIITLLGCMPFASASTVIEISDKAGLAAIAEDLSASYKLTADITLTAADFADGGVLCDKFPLGTSEADAFSGTFDGDGHTISGIVLNTNFVSTEDVDTGLPIESGSLQMSMFGYLSGTVKNVSFKNCALYHEISGAVSVLAESRVGMIASTLTKTGVIQNCAVFGRVNVKTPADCRVNVGGIVGRCIGKVENCAVYATVSAERASDVWMSVGGIAGHVDSQTASITHCYVGGAVEIKCTAATSANSNVGAVAGYNSGAVKESFFCNNPVEDYAITQAVGKVGSYAGVEGTVTDCGGFSGAEVETATLKGFDFETVWARQLIDGWMQPMLKSFVCPHPAKSEPVAYPGMEPTCQNAGTGYTTCTACGEIVDTAVVLPATGEHVWATTLTQGEDTHYYACTTDGCTAKYEEAAHTAGDIIVDTAATCSTAGVGHKDCTACGKTLETNLVIPATGEHDEDTVNVVVDTAATCTATGIGHTVCKDCGITITENVEIEKLDHIPGDWVVVKEATTSAKGLKEKYCTVCGTKADSASIPQKAPAVNFVDVKKSDFFYTPVQWAVSNGITSGTSKTTFGPNEPCTRAQAVTFLWRAAGSPAPKSSKNPFTDVKKSDYFYKAVLWAVENDITAGTSKTAFSPEESCTRGQIVTFLWRAEGGKKVNASNPFTDIKKSDYYYNAVLWAVKNNVTAGATKTTFAPNDVCTRGQIVTFLYRAIA